MEEWGDFDSDDEEVHRKRRRLAGLSLLAAAAETQEEITRDVERFYVRHELDVGSLTEEECKVNFRLDNSVDFHRLLNALQIPQIRCSNRSIASPELALAVVLRRLCFPNRWFDTKVFLGRIFNETVNYL